MKVKNQCGISKIDVVNFKIDDDKSKFEFANSWIKVDNSKINVDN